MTFDEKNFTTDQSAVQTTGTDQPSTYDPRKPASTLKEMIEAGEYLQSIKSEIRHGFAAWVEDNCQYTRKTAYKYIQRAIDAKLAVVAEHLAHITPTDVPELFGWRRMTDAEIEQAHRNVRLVHATCGHQNIADVISMTLSDCHLYATGGDAVRVIDLMIADSEAHTANLAKARETLQQLPADQPLWYSPQNRSCRAINRESEINELLDDCARSLGFATALDVSDEKLSEWRSLIKDAGTEIFTTFFDDNCLAVKNAMAEVTATEFDVPEFGVPNTHEEKDAIAIAIGDAFTDQAMKVMTPAIFSSLELERGSCGLPSLYDLPSDQCCKFIWQIFQHLYYAKIKTDEEWFNALRSPEPIEEPEAYQVLLARHERGNHAEFNLEATQQQASLSDEDLERQIPF